MNISGQLAFPEERIRALLKLRPRDTFDFGRWQEDRDRLEDFYHQNSRLAARVTASRTTNGDVVNLAYMIEAGPQTTIEVSGVEVGRDVTQRLADAWAASILDELLVDEATQIVKGALSEQGYVQPMVSARVVSQGDMKTLRVEVQPGNRSTGTRVRIDASDQVLASDLEARVAERHLAEQVIRDPGAVTRDLTDYLRSRGYLRASVKAAPALFDSGVAVLPIAVVPGPQFTLATIAFEGRRNVPDEDVSRVPTLRAVRRTTRRLSTAPASGSSRCIAAGVSHRRRLPPTPRLWHRPLVDLTFEIAEGSHQTIGDIVVSGNGGIDADVVTRALGLTIGSSLEPTELLRARTRAFDTGLFRRVDLSTEPMNRVSASDPVQPMRVRVALEAWPALRLRYGFQASEERPESDPTGRRGAWPVGGCHATNAVRTGRESRRLGPVSTAGELGRALLNSPTLMSLPVESLLVVERFTGPAGDELRQ